LVIDETAIRRRSHQVFVDTPTLNRHDIDRNNILDSNAIMVGSDVELVQTRSQPFSKVNSAVPLYY